jgi:hypothetical protein
MHRSGTSALAGMLHLAGVRAGKILLPANEFNSKGYFECADIVHVHDQLLDQLGSNWHDVRALPPGWLQTPSALDAKKKLIQIFQNEFEDSEICVLKDPRISRLLPMWLEIFHELGIAPAFIITSRDPMEVISSLAHRDGFHINKGALIYQRYVSDAEFFTRKHLRMIVSFASLLENWEAIMRSIILTFDLPISLSPEVSEKIKAFLSPDLKHFNVPEKHAGIGRPITMAIELFHILEDSITTFSPSFVKLRTDFESYLSDLEPWLSVTMQSERTEQEVIKPGANLAAAASRGAKSTLYWSTTGQLDYKESQTLAIPFHFGGETQILQFFFIPEMLGLTHIRLDLTDRPAYSKIYAARLVDDQTRVRWEWDGKMALLTSPSNEMHLLPGDGSGCLISFSSGFDPQAQVNLPSEILSAAEPGWKFIIELAIQLPHDGLQVVMDVYEQLSADLRNKNDLMNEIDTVLRQEKQLNAARTQEIIVLKERASRYLNELAGTEAQLELLKDLLLSKGSFESV